MFNDENVPVDRHLDRGTAAALKDAEVLHNTSSFRSQFMDSGTVNIGISIMAWHIMSKIPTQTISPVHPFASTLIDQDASDTLGNADCDWLNTPAEREWNAWDTQAKREWCQVLIHRSEELAVGGRLLDYLYVRDEENRPFREYNPLSKDLENDFPAQYVLLQFLREGILSEDEVRRCCRTTHPLRVSQLVATNILPNNLKLIEGPWMDTKLDEQMIEHEILLRCSMITVVSQHIYCLRKYVCLIMTGTHRILICNKNRLKSMNQDKKRWVDRKF
jgi:hypothetical protein